MTKRRDTLQRISRIDNLHTARQGTQDELRQEDAPCGRLVGIMTIEAVLDLYMTEISSPIKINLCLLPEQYRRPQAEKTKEQPEEQSGPSDTGAEEARPQMTLFYDALDVNRGSGFLFYSYDKHGAHSILGEERAGGYGDYMVSGAFSAVY
ncbi:MAG: hypothetical protein NC337_03905 [Roseburia sp.]|nr:hypothetical protein [Roseburia sp.]